MPTLEKAYFFYLFLDIQLKMLKTISLLTYFEYHAA